MHCVTGEAPRAKFCATAQIRSRARAATVAVTPLPTGKARARFSSAQRGITPGQFLVLYNGDIVLGGGAICSPGQPPDAGVQLQDSGQVHL